jgi:DNA-binding NarL/FixJ family response regulator
VNINVLIIEDNDGDYLLIQNALENHTNRFKLNRAKTLKEGLTKLKTIETDLVMADLHLSDSNGVETVEKIRENLCDGTPIVVLTGADEDEIIEQCIRRGAYTFLNKNEANGNLRRAILAAHTKHKQEEEKTERFVSAIRESFAFATTT